MAIIDSNGLFLGDRLAWCSDEAQLHWPRLYSAANNYARLELNYKKIVSHAYVNFRKPPTEVQFWAWVKEYRDNFLLLVYPDQSGNLWGQWQTNDRYLLGKKNAADNRSPKPPQNEQDNYRKAYIARKMAKCIGNQVLADLGGDEQGSAELGAIDGIGIAGVGVGVGVGEKQEQKQKQPPKQAQAPFVLPEWIDLQVWNAFEEMRKKIRKPLTDHARDLTVTKVAAYRARGHDPRDVLNNSIQNNWTGVFEPKESHGTNHGIPENKWDRLEREALALMDAEKTPPDG